VEDWKMNMENWKMKEETVPLYEVEELTVSEAILLMASEQEKYQADFQASSDRLMQLVA
jgi:hypothetical protein